MGSVEVSQSRLLKATTGVVEAYNSWDLDKIMAIRAPECITQVLPRSLGRPEMKNDEYSKYLGGFMSAFTNFHVTINEVVEDPVHNKVSVWAQSTADTPVGPYANEYMLLLHFDEAHEKLVKFYEFVDSKYTVEHFTKVRELMEKKGDCVDDFGTNT
ncbi:uncharacterized protein B0I36DRAFT_16186 [Microdochium trichocladiopsis]|uniref:SnoaL-like domain-containing protein n=1 Tax=Microdochium trichocladiopsis TaxID=1682393 RepID=A0A9P8YIW7_9PEZI|nr:uncharacterized protein B0I36DRAFT_16186 [Microdochium trichocladiopsis]KAH7040853.1 hypothetical protein B0I36DRAFT_16186 [Microdochium trichocladiopsis]